MWSKYLSFSIVLTCDRWVTAQWRSSGRSSVWRWSLWRGLPGWFSPRGRWWRIKLLTGRRRTDRDLDMALVSLGLRKREKRRRKTKEVRMREQIGWESGALRRVSLCVLLIQLLQGGGVTLRVCYRTPCGLQIWVKKHKQKISEINGLVFANLVCGATSWYVCRD